MKQEALNSLSPLDGRYQDQSNELRKYFSEGALIRYRLRVEVNYLIELSRFLNLTDIKEEALNNIWKMLSENDLLKIKKIESTIKHDIKAVEYFLKTELHSMNMGNLTEWVHFGLTSEDVNNLAYSLMLRDSLKETIIPEILKISDKLRKLSGEYASLPMLARTHGQAASPTTLGKETGIFLERLLNETEEMAKINLKGKLNGASGNYNSFYAAFPDKDWLNFSRNFIEKMGLNVNLFTTQIEPHDDLARIFDSISRINNILLDLNTDIWYYISLGYFKLKKNDKEVGSSTMPHKINPIDFENSEGNLGLANSMLEFMKNKLSRSRLQRDLSDSTVLRNIGVALGYSLIAYKSNLRGLNKLSANHEIISADLNNNTEVLAEAIQTILRANNFEKPYELLKTMTRGNKLSYDDLIRWAETLETDEKIKSEIKKLKVENYTGIASELAKLIVEKSKRFIL